MAGPRTGASAASHRATRLYGVKPHNVIKYIMTRVHSEIDFPKYSCKCRIPNADLTSKRTMELDPAPGSMRLSPVCSGRSSRRDLVDRRGPRPGRRPRRRGAGGRVPHRPADEGRNRRGDRRRRARAPRADGPARARLRPGARHLRHRRRRQRHVQHQHRRRARRRRGRRAGGQARQPRRVQPLRQCGRARANSACPSRPGPSGRRRASTASASRSASPRTSTAAWRTSRRCAARSASARSSTCSARSRTRRGPTTNCSASASRNCSTRSPARSPSSASAGRCWCAATTGWTR